MSGFPIKTRHACSGDPSEANREFFSSGAVVSFYSEYSELTRAELRMFEGFIKPGSRILDLGVGGGRTTAYLAARASRYVGVDYSPEMIETCGRKFQNLEFQLLDASDLSAFPSGSFDAVVFSYNGLDYLNPHAKRCTCIKECHRVLANGGVFIFSVHNPRSLFVQPDKSLIRRRLQELGGGNLCSHSVVSLLLLPALAWVFMKTVFLRSAQSLFTSIFWRGEGYLKDEVNPGLVNYAATPRRVKRELADFAFETLEVLGGNYPEPSSMVSTGWFYYSARKLPVPNPPLEIRAE